MILFMDNFFFLEAHDSLCKKLNDLSHQFEVCDRKISDICLKFDHMNEQLQNRLNVHLDVVTLQGLIDTHKYSFPMKSDFDKLRKELERVESKLLGRSTKVGNAALPTRRVLIFFLQDNKSIALRLFVRLNRCTCTKKEITDY